MSRVIFMGSDVIALPLLQRLKGMAGQLAVISGPDRLRGRGQQLQPNDISAWAIANGVELYRPEKLTEDFYKTIQAWAPDIFIVMAYGKILRQVWIDLPRRGTWNLHASLLPQLRGASPLETAIATGRTETGVGLMKMVLALDAGPVGPVARVAIPPEMTAAQLRTAVGEVSANLVGQHWGALMAGTVKTVPQEETRATYCRMLSPRDVLLDPAAPAVELANRVRALGTWPGSALEYKGERLKIIEAKAVKIGLISARPGEVVESGERLVIAVGVGVDGTNGLELITLQRPGGKRLAAKDFLRGYPIGAGEHLLGARMMPLERAGEPFPRG